ncbi:hypothetical protein [Bacillus toyonensis]|uniref:hypothetical protein n=1 Tax=Bacillus toyonensis TaxID=155322 RepID=UPI000BEC015A|nr:hypothetical protein [Bacillus toyonensis]PEF96447.1 hypothetical protein COO01_24095 [Bacillus toyonensis]PHC48195.1 hypothetical protein COF08_23420 [Bacillus toyonensis]
MCGSVQVITYENPYTFHNLKEFQPYAQTIHICATASLAKGVQQTISKNKDNVFSAGKIMNKFYPDWNHVERRFIQYAQLSDILREWRGDVNKEVLTAFKRNKLNLLITMRNLTEIGLSPQQIKRLDKEKTIEEALFCEIWECMLPNFHSYMRDAMKKLQSLQTITNVFSAELNANKIENNTVVLHGFYYISPVQHYVFTKWREKGINLVFLNLYNEKYPAVFSFLRENFSMQYGWIDSNQWTITKDVESLYANHFAAAFEGDFTNQQAVNLEEKSYEYMIEFVNDIQNNSHYISPNHEELRERVREFRPEAYQEERHFLSYPMGQYLFHLHSLWNEEKQDYYMTENLLMECFASGWLQEGEENARDYTEQLKRILPYFEDCKTVKDWIHSMRKLMITNISSGKVLKNYNLKKSDSLKAVRISPTLRFSYFSVSVRELKVIEQFLHKLVKNANWLFHIQGERVSIHIHFHRIKKLLEESNVKNTLLSEQEKQLVLNLENMLAISKKEETEYHIGDLAEAILVYLKNGISDSETVEEDTSQEDSNKRTKLSIKKMEDLDGAILNEDEKTLHLCGMDEKHFPSARVPMPWPLSKELLKSLNNNATNMYLFRSENRISFAKYLFYTALCYKGQIELSWIKNWNEYKGLQKSIYVQLLGNTLNNPGDSVSYQYLKKNIEPSEKEALQAQNYLSSLPNEEFIEMDLCQRRFLYSSVLDGFATYHSSFHQQFLIGNIIKIYGAIGKEKSEIIKILQDLFPFLSQIRLDSLVNENLNKNYVLGMKEYGLGRKREYEDIKYSDSVTYFQFLTHRGAFQNEKWKTAFELLNEKKGRKKELIRKFTLHPSILSEANPSEFCKLCPHNEYCEEAYYDVDLAKKGFDDNEVTGI